MKKVCDQVNCEKAVLAFGMCSKHYHEQYYAANKAKHQSQMKTWRAENAESFKAMVKASKAKNPGYYSNYVSDWQKANKDLTNAKTARRRAKRFRATPPWVDPAETDSVVALYRQAADLGLHVDHIIPLQGEQVCGLNLLCNLQLLTPSENKKKSNKLPPHQDQLAAPRTRKTAS